MTTSWNRRNKQAFQLAAARLSGRMWGRQVPFATDTLIPNFASGLLGKSAAKVIGTLAAAETAITDSEISAGSGLRASLVRRTLRHLDRVGITTSVGNMHSINRSHVIWPALLQLISSRSAILDHVGRLAAASASTSLSVAVCSHHHRIQAKQDGSVRIVVVGWQLDSNQNAITLAETLRNEMRSLTGNDVEIDVVTLASLEERIRTNDVYANEVWWRSVTVYGVDISSTILSIAHRVHSEVHRPLT